VTLCGNTHRTVGFGKAVLSNVVLDKIGNYSVTITGTMNVNGNLTIADVGSVKGGTIAVAGDVTTTDETVGGDATVRFDGRSDQKLSAGGGTGGIVAVEIAKSRGTLRVRDTIRLSGPGKAWTCTSGKVDMTKSVIELHGSVNLEVDCGSTVFNDVVVNMSGTHSIDVTGVMDVDGDLTCSSGSIKTGTVAVAGNVVTTCDKFGGQGVIRFDGDKDQELRAGGGSGAVPGVEIDKSGGTLHVRDTILVTGSHDPVWKHKKGKVQAGTSTVEFKGRNKTVDSGEMSFGNVAVVLASNHALTVTGTMHVGGNLTITEVGRIDVGTIVVGGKLINNDKTNPLRGSAVIKVGGSTIRLEPGPGRAPGGRTGRTKGRVPPHLRKKGPPWTR
jgi:hypothetical protein